MRVHAPLVNALLAVSASADTASVAPLGRRAVISPRAGPLVAAYFPPPVAREHLLWQPGFGTRFSGSLVVSWLVVLAATRGTDRLPALVALARRLEISSALGLLGSSCCALQLVLNAFSVGCAGFNKLLGPLRPHALALACTLQVFVWRAALFAPARAPALRAAAGTTLVAAALGLLPEAVHLRTARVARRGKGGAGELWLAVGGMGCTACTAKVKASAEAIDGVAYCSVMLEQGAARVWLDGPVNTAALLSALGAAGFPSTRTSFSF